MKNLREELKKRIPTVEAAYKETGRPEVDFSVYPEDLRVHKKACYDAEILVEAARKIERENGSGEIDWSDYNQYKYIPWFKMSPSSFAFCVTFYGFGFTDAGCGSRLRVLARETAAYLGEKFIEIWENVQLG
jgi:hypothetical protein